MAKKMWSVTGEKLVARNLLSLAAKYPKAAAKSLNHEAELTMAAAKALTPVATGTLRRSGKVSEHASAANLKAVLSFGTSYALAVHEIPPPPRKSPGGRSAIHRRHQVGGVNAGSRGGTVRYVGTGGQWKYLETPLNQRARLFAKRIGNGIQALVKKA